MHSLALSWPDRAQDTLARFGTSATDGLSSRRVQELIATHGYNEFTVSTPEPLLIKFAKTIYENPLIILLCGSAIVSAVMGNIDDAVSITVAVLIVLTGKCNAIVTVTIWCALSSERARSTITSRRMLVHASRWYVLVPLSSRWTSAQR